MAYIESHQEIGRHPKTKQCAVTLGISIPAMIGHLHLLWHWCLDFAQDGDLSRRSAEVIADAAMWDGDAQDFVNGLVNSEFLDRESNGLFVHDWEEYGGKLIERRHANAARMRRARGYDNAPVPEPKEPSKNGVYDTCVERATNVHKCAEREETREEKSTLRTPSTERVSRAHTEQMPDFIPALESSPLFSAVLEVTGKTTDYAMGHVTSNWRMAFAKVIGKLTHDGRTVADVELYRAKLPVFLGKPPPDVTPPQPNQILDNFDRVIAHKERKLKPNGHDSSPTARKVGAIIDHQNARRAAAGIAPRGENGGTGNASMVPRTHGRT